jgi:hypothetical protein
MAVIKPGGFQRNAVDPIVALFTKKLVVKGRTTGSSTRVAPTCWRPGARPTG